MPQGFAIAIDGPVASGKGTIAARLSMELQALYLYTGGMYRSVALACIKRGLDVTNPEHVISVLGSADIQIVEHSIILNGQDVTERIKEADTASGGSIVAVIPHVRKVLVKRQQEIAKEAIEKGRIVVAEGRDTGTVVFPDAALKVYLTAAQEIRAKRRLAQYQEPESAFDKVLAAVKERDERDMGRKLDPLPHNPAELDYVIIDNSNMTEDETLEAIKKELRKRNLI
jgi:cytidylate kinase